MLTRLSCVNNFNFDIGKSKKICYAYMIGGTNKARRLLTWATYVESCEGDSIEERKDENN